MAVTYGFFDSIQGDRVYNADDISNYFLKLISNGVFATPSNAMQVQANSGMTVGVTAGWGFINCKWINNSTTYLVTLDTPDVALPRIDRIVMRLDKSVGVRSIVITNKSGTPSANPTAPALQRSGNIYELSLAQIAVGADVSEISQTSVQIQNSVDLLQDLSTRSTPQICLLSSLMHLTCGLTPSVTRYRQQT